MQTSHPKASDAEHLTKNDEITILHCTNNIMLCGSSDSVTHRLGLDENQ